MPSLPHTIKNKNFPAKKWIVKKSPFTWKHKFVQNHHKCYIIYLCDHMTNVLFVLLLIIQVNAVDKLEISNCTEFVQSLTLVPCRPPKSIHFIYLNCFLRKYLARFDDKILFWEHTLGVCITFLLKARDGHHQTFHHPNKIRKPQVLFF